MPSLVLLGDSILDNAPYTAPAPDTATHLRRLLGGDWSVELLARDGATMSDMPRQLAQLATRPDWAVLSIGGNDVARYVGLLDRPMRHAGDLLEELVRIGDAFAESYRAVLEGLAPRAARVVACTIYEVPLEPPTLARHARVPLGMLNDWIARLAAETGATLLDLRTVCTGPADFVLQIEPSAQGAEKIARSIARLIGTLSGAAATPSPAFPRG